jgi:hypothetical protein
MHAQVKFTMIFAVFTTPVYHLEKRFRYTNMSDWRFASISGFLTWTTPSAPDGGVELFSELSPTLIIALQEQGDTLPVDYIKLLSITSVSLSPGSRGIELTREGAPPVLLVAATAENAHEWYSMIQTAIGDSALSSRIKPRQQQTATAPAAQAVSPQETIPHGEFAAAGSSTGSMPRPRAASNGSHQSLGFPAAPMPTVVTAASGPTSRQGSETGSLRLQLPSPSQQVQAAPQAASSLTHAPPRSQVSAALSQPPPWVQAAMAASASSSTLQQPPQPLPPRASSTADTDPRNMAHSFKPLSDITGIPARTTTTTTYVDHNRPSASGVGSLAFSAAPISAASNLAAPASSAAVNNRWEPSNAVQPSWTPLAARSSQPGQFGGVSAASPQPQPAGLSTFPSRPLPSQPQHSVSPIVQDDRGASADGPRYDDLPPMQQSSLGYRKRSGMLVDVPPNPQVNRNNAPNVSAIWKEWSGPDGVLYVCHEQTGTLQRRNPETGEFETLVDGTQEIHPDDMALHPYTGEETAVDVNNSVMKNVDRYGGARGMGGMHNMSVSSPSVYRAAPVMSPRGQYSPTRRSQLSSLAPPRQNQSAYNGRRVHHLTLGPNDEQAEGDAIEHKIQLLGGSGLRWDPQSGKVVAPEAANQGDVGASTLHRQWEHVRKILMQGRYFRKHALRTSGASFRYAFLTSDNAYVVCVPTSEVLFNVNEKPKTFHSMTETVQYYGPESRAIALNTITHVSLGTEEQFVRNRAASLAPENTFCIVSRTHAFILECNTAEEAKYFADAWTFFLYHSKPTNTAKQRTQQVKHPVTFGTRGGIAF